MAGQIQFFQFTVVPERYSRFSPVYYDPVQPYPAVPPYYEIEVRYGDQKYQLRNPLPPDDYLLSGGYLEHLIRAAVEEFKKCINREADEKARKELERKQKEFVKAADDYKKRATG